MSKLFRSQKFFVELVGSVLILALAPLLAVSALLFGNTQQAFEEQIVDANLRYLRQTVNSFELVKDQFDSSFRQLLLDNTIATYETYSNGELLERASRSSALADLHSVSDYLQAKSRMFNKITDLRLSSSFITSVYFYEPAKSMILTDNWGQYSLGEFFDQEAIEIMQDSDGVNFKWQTRVSNQRHGPERRVVSVRLPSLVDENAFVINMHAERIYNRIIRNTTLAAGTSTFVVDHNGNTVLYDDSRYNADDIASFAFLNDPPVGSGRRTSTILQNNNLITYVHSPSLEWTFVSRTSLDVIYQNVQSLGRFFYLITGAVFVLVLVLALVATRWLYSPVLRLVRHLGESHSAGGAHAPLRSRIADPDSDEDGNLGEFNYIEDTIEKTIRERERLTERLSESLPAYREKLIRSLIRPGPHDREQLRSRLEFAGVDLEYEDVTVLTIAIDAAYHNTVDPKEAGITALRIVDNIRSSILAVTKGDVAEIDEGRYVAIINSGTPQMGLVFRCTETLREELHGEFGTDCTIGVGNNQDSIDTASVSYNESIEALKHGLLGGNGEIIHIQDIRIGQVYRSEYLENRIETMQNFVKSGEPGSAHRVLDEIAEDLSRKKREGPYRQIQKIVTEILISFMDSLEIMGGDWYDICPEYDSPFATLARMSDFREIFDWYGQLIDRCADYFAEARTTRSWGYAEKVMSLIEEDCGRTVNLYSLAARLNLNPSYLGRIFKEEVGMNFIDYLTRARINKSKELLTTTGLTVEQVGKEVGYSNSYYFIRLFKELNGTTPGHYKKHHGSTDPSNDVG